MNTLFVVICVFVELSQACELPPAGPEIDWSRILGKHWYEVANSRSPIDELYTCYDLIYYKEVPGGYMDTATTRNRNGVVKQVPSRVTKTPDGYYTVEYGKDVGSPEDVVKDLERSNMTVEEGHEEFLPKIAYYTNHENYFLILGCRPADDQMEFWHFAPNLNPSAEDVLRVTNILGQIGGGWSRLQLSTTRCVEK